MATEPKGDRGASTPWMPGWRIFIAIWVALLLVKLLIGECAKTTEISYTRFKTHLAQDEVAKVTISDNWIRGELDEGVLGERTFKTARVEDPKLLEELDRHEVDTTGVASSPGWSSWMSWLIPIALIVVLWSWLRRRVGGAAGPGVMTFGRSKARLYMEQEVGVTFDDVAGVDEAKEELTEVIDFLKTPEKFQRLGGKLPKGILLVGPPGTGKTLLARAVAGEAGVPFFSISGSEFVEMFVGVGAARVRDLFNEAKRKAPCIIFIDELDAIGKARGIGPMAHEEREQTLNQLLVELDGFDPHSGVVLMAATNRPEILDPALLRAGRFDRHVVVDRPDRGGRLAILEVHTRTIELADDADLDVVAGMTAGFAGADLANIINEAALLAVRRGKDAVDADDLSEAVERVIAGLEKKNRVLRPDEKARVAHHEVGHALVARAMPSSDRIQKISIIPRGIAALGYTLQLPTEDRFLMTRSELEAKVAVLLGGRAAEELVYGEVSTGAQDDLRKATDIARSMVDTYGMSERIGQVSFRRETLPLLLPGGEGRKRDDYSEETAREIDCEVRRIVDEQYDRAREILGVLEPALHAAAEELLDHETISGDDLDQIVRSTTRPDRHAPSLQ